MKYNKYAILILGEGDTDDSPRNEIVVEAKSKQDALAAGKRFYRLLAGKHSRVARARRLSRKECAARYGDCEGYMNGGYLDHFNPFTMEGYLE